MISPTFSFFGEKVHFLFGKVALATDEQKLVVAVHKFGECLVSVHVVVVYKFGECLVSVHRRVNKNKSCSLVFIFSLATHEEKWTFSPKNEKVGEITYYVYDYSLQHK